MAQQERLEHLEEILEDRKVRHEREGDGRKWHQAQQRDKRQAAGRAEPADAVQAVDDAAEETDGTQGGWRRKDRTEDFVRLSQT
jgi:hypothetical protein